MLQVDVRSISNPRVRQFYTAYLPQRRVLYDFYELLDEANYDYRIVDIQRRRSDSPRETLAHIVRAHAALMRAMRTGRLEERPEGLGHLERASKAELLAEMDLVDAEMLEFLLSDEFQAERRISAPWGEVTAADLLRLVRDHDILHIGWNLAIMDLLDMDRYPSLEEYWG